MSSNSTSSASDDDDALFGSTNNTTNNMPLERLLELDRRHVWHPYASIPASYDSVVVESAHGVYLNVKQGGSGRPNVDLVDGMSSWWAAIHGYNHPVLN